MLIDQRAPTGQNDKRYNFIVPVGTFIWQQPPFPLSKKSRDNKIANSKNSYILKVI